MQTRTKRFALDFVNQLIWLILAWGIAYWIRFKSGWFFAPKGFISFVQFFDVFIYVLAAFIITELLYRPKETESSFSFWSYVNDSVQKHIYYLFVLIAILFFFRETIFSRLSIIIFWCIWTFGTLASVHIWKKWLNHPKQKGMLWIDPIYQNHDHLLPKELTQSYHLHILEDVEELKPGSITLDRAIFILTPFQKLHHYLHVTQSLVSEQGNALTFLVPHLPQKDYNIPIFFRGRRWNQTPCLDLQIPQLSDYELWLKRMIDICVSILVLITCIPLFIIIALLIKLTSKGPIFYKQDRVGLDGRIFPCYKFRAMRVDAEKDTPIWASPNDTRTTSIGRWLRRFSIDELPQFWNVLKGDMSIVGPRPERPYFVEEFAHTHIGYPLRLKMKAGITGWAQIKGLRGQTSLSKRIEADFWYITNWSLWLDLYIMLITPYKMLKGDNAY